MKRALAAAALALTLTGCAAEYTGEAVVVGRHHSPGYTSIIAITNGSGGSTMVPQWNPDSWSVTVRTADGEEVTQLVSEHCYHTVTTETRLTADQLNTC